MKGLLCEGVLKKHDRVETIIWIYKISFLGLTHHWSILYLFIYVWSGDGWRDKRYYQWAKRTQHWEVIKKQTSKIPSWWAGQTKTQGGRRYIKSEGNENTDWILWTVLIGLEKLFQGVVAYHTGPTTSIHTGI